MKTMMMLVALICLLIGGCAGQSPYYTGSKALWGVMGPEYRGYVQQDARLSENDKAIRLRSADTMDQLIITEGGEGGGK